MGRFVGEDSFGGQVNNPLSQNRFTYVHNNPLTQVDPSGHWCASSDGKWSMPGGCDGGILDKKILASVNGSIYTADWDHEGKSIKKNGVEGDTYHYDSSNDSASEDYLSLGIAAVGGAACIVSCMALSAAAIGTADVATMGTTISSGAIIAGKAFGFGFGARAWNWAKGVFGKGDETVSLYRTMSETELQGIAKTKMFEDGYNMSGKWMADKYDDAVTWMNDPVMVGNTRIVEVTLPKNVVDNAYFRPNLDNIGPAHYFELDVLNSSYISVKVVK